MSKRRLTEADNQAKKKRRHDAGEPDPSKEDEDDDSPINQSQNPDFNTSPEAEVGIIEKISVKNFMCHTRLDVNFGPHVNFIVGRNGSGKSAVVAALVVGLGGKASVTSRGSTIKGFIKSGKSTGEVQIKLRNRGPDAFRHEMYGDSITVQRKFTSEGSSKYQLLSKTGVMVSDKREELFHLLDQFNIQVDNPVAILNQETSRNFLNSKSPQDKYKFFLKATQLETMKHDYAKANEQKSITLEIISQKERTLPTLEKEVLEWEHKFKSLDAIDELKKNVKHLKNEMAWSLVAAKERGLEPIKKKLDQEDSRTPKYVKKVEEVKENLEKCQQTHRQIQDQILAISEEVQKLEPQRKQAKSNMQQKRDAARQAQNEVNKTEKDLRTSVRDRDMVKERIEEIKNSAQHDYESERRARQEKIDQLMEKSRGLESQQRTTEHQKNQFRDAVTKYTNDGYTIRRDEQGIQDKQDSDRQQLKMLMAARSDRLKRFGQFIPNITKRIDEFHRKGYFHERPRGPLGSCFQLRDPEWALSVESCLKALLHAFCCTDHHDEKVLEGIFEREIKDGRHPSIIVSRFTNQIHDISRFRVQSEHPCILDMLNIEDTVVANTLIDQRSVENIILIADNKEARRVMQHCPPRNCKQAYTKVGDEIYCHPTFRYYSANVDKARYLTANVEEEIAHYEGEIQSLQRELDNVRQQRNKLTEDIRRNKSEEKKCNTQLMKIEEAIQNLQFEISELKNVEDPAPIDIATLEDEVATYDEQITNLKEKRQEVSKISSEQQLQLVEVEKAYRDVEGKLKSLTDSADPLKEEDGHALNEIEVAKNHKKHYEGKLKEHERVVNELRKDVNNYQTELDADMEKAKAICPERIKTRRVPQNLESEIRQTMKRIQTEEKSHGNPDEITRKYHETQQAFRKIRREVNQLKKFIEELDISIGTRMSRYVFIRQSYSYRVKVLFIEHTSMTKSMRGSLSINHNTEEIVLKVQPTSSSAEGAKDLKSLSGGERSFSTVCFILALWDAMESPFRCLDEFDVFMDMVNRRISMDMMMEVARVQTGRQFIFLTPQDMSQLHIGIDSRIFRMPDPDRGQGVLPFAEGQAEEEEA
ncbi:structural maintenance of chromosomes protein 6-like isoform X1 [Haliotis rufescens]|uniref:structural maintenance of chromosomes protein 6-like isoform X1 n=1 Tax=Haliotis rufescens TaxID=6454 RepID=UPI00201F4F70|nr:structural maintenance of chromosomes protein 6-like isoform X1 [Haliotis rufescens]